jgi:hypothetical protein
MSAAAFPLPLIVDASGPRQVLQQPFIFNSPTVGQITVEAGFDTDFASVPRALWWLYPPWGDYKRAAVVHDWAYWYKPFDRDVADRIFLEGMEALGIPWHRRHILHKSVRAGGWLAWSKNQKQRQAKPATA